LRFDVFVIEKRVFKFFSVKGFFVVQIVENAGEFLFFRPSRENPIFGKRLCSIQDMCQRYNHKSLMGFADG